MVYQGKTSVNIIWLVDNTNTWEKNMKEKSFETWNENTPYQANQYFVCWFIIKLVWRDFSIEKTILNFICDKLQQYKYRILNFFGDPWFLIQQTGIFGLEIKHLVGFLTMTDPGTWVFVQNTSKLQVVVGKMYWTIQDPFFSTYTFSRICS